MPVTLLAGSMLDQEIRLDAVVADGRLIAKNLATSRASIVEHLVTQPVVNVPRLLSQLFPLCGMAHAAAGLQAIEAALQIQVSPMQRRFRELMLLAEHGAALGWRITMDWPLLLGEPADTRACAEIRRAVASVSTATNCRRWAQIGGVTLRLERERLEIAVRELARVLIDLFPEAADPALSWSKLDRALQGGHSIPARLVKTARTGALTNYGRHDLPWLPSMSADWFSAHLVAAGDFCRRPTLDGTPAEVGPLAARRHPFIVAAIADWGPTLATRLLASALDAAVVAQRLRDALGSLGDDQPVAADVTRTGRGTGVVETARGPLAYLVDVADGRVRMLRSVAPTEWNFHPDGPFIAALECAPRVSDPVFAARLLAASFDPCVPFAIALTDNLPAPADAEIAHA